MGSGKTTIGRALAEELGWTFFDLDDEIERREDHSISHIFETRGEAEFRRLETAALQERVRAVERGRPQVVALGGGAFLTEANFQMVNNNGVSVWLDCPLARIERRIADHNHRPLARDPAAFRALYEARLAGYQRADYRIEVDSDDCNAAVALILGLPLF
jgi:shikimate kinase